MRFVMLDENNETKQTEPIYEYQPSGNDQTGSLNITLGNNTTARILNYDLDKKSLNINLRRKNEGKESEASKEIDNASKKEFADNEINQSTAHLYPVLEDDIITCPHGGKVLLKSTRGKSFKSDGVPVILESDFINSSIVGCSAKSPCTKVALVPNSALSQKKINGEYALMQDFVSNCLSDKGASLICSKKPNKFKLSHTDVPAINTAAKSNEDLDEYKKSNIRLHFKSDNFQKDNMGVCIYTLNDIKFENKEGFESIELNLDEARDISDKKLKTKLKENYKEDYDFKEFNLKFGREDIALIFVVPKYIYKINKQIYDDANRPSEGVGYFSRLYEYEDITQKDDGYTPHTYAFYTPQYAKKISIDIAKGHDDNYEQSLDVCGVKVVCGKILMGNEI